MLQLTDSHKNRVITDWNKIAGEELEYIFGETVQDTIYALGSELACLRLFYKLGRGDVQFSKNLNKWRYSNAK